MNRSPGLESRYLPLCSGLAAALLASVAPAQNTEMHGGLSGSQEVPAVTSAGGGSVTVTVFSGPGVVSVSGDFTGLSGSAIGFHLHGPAGIGSESNALLVDASGTSGTAGTFIGANNHLSPSEMQAVLDGQTYFHIHTAAHQDGEVRAQIVQRLNLVIPPQLATDPVLADSGGNAALGPRIQHTVERFNVLLDCSGAGAPGVYTIVIRPDLFPFPAISRFGYLWGIGPRLLSCPGLHSRSVVECFSPPGVILPGDVALVGLTYVVQGFCGDPSSSGGRTSNALLQWIGI